MIADVSLCQPIDCCHSKERFVPAQLCSPRGSIDNGEINSDQTKTRRISFSVDALIDKRSWNKLASDNESETSPLWTRFSEKIVSHTEMDDQSEFESTNGDTHPFHTLFSIERYQQFDMVVSLQRSFASVNILHGSFFQSISWLLLTRLIHISDCGDNCRRDSFAMKRQRAIENNSGSLHFFDCPILVTI